MQEALHPTAGIGLTSGEKAIGLHHLRRFDQLKQPGLTRTNGGILQQLCNHRAIR
jgi:hypothetical protein